jgi:hypothetical protein
MSEEILSVAELERLSRQEWRHHEMLRVCRHALALEAEVARLRRQIEAQRHEVHEDDGDA